MDNQAITKHSSFPERLDARIWLRFAKVLDALAIGFAYAWTISVLQYNVWFDGNTPRRRIPPVGTIEVEVG